MSIELTCEGCGKTLKAPDTAAGKRKPCPACGHEVYVRTPSESLEELPLAPVDESEDARQRRLQEERRRLDRQLAAEKADDEGAAGSGGAASASRAPEASASGESIEQLVLGYLQAMRDADFDRADGVLPKLRSRRPDALRVVDQLSTDQVVPDAMGGVPPAVYFGYLKNLRSQL